ncbi:MAG: helix-turn-helix transcriptional regulator [Alphaproteobacteria bacterium]|nr:helix-turn-helix transcriptional regulator [Alphaproteobacteria bacterium]
MRAQIVVARNLRRLRVARSLPQEKLAVDAKVDRTYVSRLERGLENPTVAVLERLSIALGANISDFFDAARVARGPVKPLPSGRHPRNSSSGR